MKNKDLFHRLTEINKDEIYELAWELSRKRKLGIPIDDSLDDEDAPPTSIFPKSLQSDKARLVFLESCLAYLVWEQGGSVDIPAEHVMARQLAKVENTAQTDGNYFRLTAGETDRERFVAHLKRATEIVSTWPEWKQTILGGAPASPDLTPAEYARAQRNASFQKLCSDSCEAIANYAEKLNAINNNRVDGVYGSIAGEWPDDPPHDCGTCEYTDTTRDRSPCLECIPSRRMKEYQQK